MKKVFFLLIATCIYAGLSAQKREGNVITVQGHHHEVLTRQAAQGKGVVQPVQSVDTSTYNVYNINPGDVSCTVGCTTVDPTITEPDSTVTVSTAYLMIKWTDGKAALRPGTYHDDSILIWRYQWVSRYWYKDTATVNPYSYWATVNKTSIDMIRAVANFDSRFSTLLQNTSGGNFAVGGFGYNFGDADTRVLLRYDSIAAKADSAHIKFKYGNYPNCLAPYNQFVPQEYPTPGNLATQAIALSSNTGVIKHPLDAAYGYPAYDYDYWVLINPNNRYYEWQAGWNYNYWSFNTRQGLSGSFTYPTTSGIATEPLNNNTVHYFVFASAQYYSPVNLDGDYSNPACSLLFCGNCGQH
ncbi:MAG: hypothetical protein LBK45_05960 [Tannerellaceae bacterium]|jgi:hypothetical protein|nr:hypothetical protein [Tannerellaceae bacterium]